MAQELNGTPEKREGERKEPNMTIGKVTLDLSRYPGEDFYSDGAVEEELLKIARDLSPVEYGKVIDEKKSWPVLYHFSRQRENIVDWIPLTKADKVLEVGSGCGAITGALARKAGCVTCVDLSKRRSQINAWRNGDYENVTIHVGNFQDVEPDLAQDYDLICLIGVFEYGISYIGGETPFEDFLKILKAHLKPGGRIVIAIENRLGLKYFAGCQEDHLGTYYSGITNYSEGGGVRTFSRPALEKMFRSCGLEEFHFYYPYPDYKFMTTLYSDECLPKKGELSNNLRNFDRDRILLFDEKNAYDGILDDGLFPVFSNSYLVVLGPGYPTQYARYSNDRAPQFQICTKIETTEDNAAGKVADKAEVGRAADKAEAKRIVRKLPLCVEAKDHVSGLFEAQEKLKERYAGGELLINRCQLKEGEDGLPCAEFEFVKGVTLAELMDRAIAKENPEEFQGLFREYLRRIGYNEESPVADYDLVFSNILVDGDTWTLIDYEWTFGKTVETRELAFRAVLCYLLEDESRQEKLALDWILEVLGVAPEEAQAYREQEEEFQRYVTGQRLSMPQLRELIGKKVIRPWKMLRDFQDAEKIYQVQVYEDKGEGYSEDRSYFVKDAYQTEKELELELKVDGDVNLLRIDPMMDACMVKVVEMTLNGERIPLENKKILKVNGRSTGGENPTIVFATEDPNLGIDLRNLNRNRENLLYAKLEVTRIPKNAAEDLLGALARHIRF